MNKTVESNALTTMEQTSSEMTQTSNEAHERFLIQTSMIMAIEHPRNEDEARYALIDVACKRTQFASSAMYSFPRGGKLIEGASINLAREAKRVWGNIWNGMRVVFDDDNTRTIECIAWDLQTNVYISKSDTFKKLIQRKDKEKNITKWIAPDERDLRELTNRRASLLERNGTLQLLPPDLIEDAMEACRITRRAGIQSDPESHKKKTISAFSTLNVTPVMLEKLLEHPLGECTPAEIDNLRNIYQSLKDGDTVWKDYAKSADPETKQKKKPEKLKDLIPKEEPPITDPNEMLPGEMTKTFYVIVEDKKETFYKEMISAGLTPDTNELCLSDEVTEFLVGYAPDGNGTVNARVSKELNDNPQEFAKKFASWYKSATGE